MTAESERLARANAEHHAVSRRILEKVEAERRHIAREIHDDFGQQLTGLQLLLQHTLSSAPRHLKPPLREARQATVELLDRVRNFSMELHPPVLDDLGLLPALDWHFKRFQKRTRIRVAFEKKKCNEELLNDFLKNSIFRLAQEALTNVARHAETKQVVISLVTRQGRCSLRVHDFGKGFDADADAVKDGAGINGMRERVLLAGGRFSLKSRPNQGTHLEIDLPLFSDSGG